MLANKLIIYAMNLHKACKFEKEKINNEHLRPKYFGYLMHQIVGISRIFAPGLLQFLHHSARSEALDLFGV